MSELASKIYDESNGLDYVLMGDYYIPDIQLDNESPRPIGHWGRLHMEYLKEYRPAMYNELFLSGKLWSYLADLNEQAEEWLERIIQQMKETEGVREKVKVSQQLVWVRQMNSIRNRAEEIVLHEMIYF